MRDLLGAEVSPLVLFRGTDTWFVRDTDPSVLELFGTDILPTAYLASVPAREVSRYIHVLNPGRTVLIQKG